MNTPCRRTRTLTGFYEHLKVCGPCWWVYRAMRVKLMAWAMKPKHVRKGRR